MQKQHDQTGISSTLYKDRPTYLDRRVVVKKQSRVKTAIDTRKQYTDWGSGLLRTSLFQDGLVEVFERHKIFVGQQRKLSSTHASLCNQSKSSYLIDEEQEMSVVCIQMSYCQPTS